MIIAHTNGGAPPSASPPAVAGPALGALGGKLASKLIPTGSGGSSGGGGSIFSQAAGNIQGGYQGFNPQQSFANQYGGGNFGNTLGGGYDPNGVSVPANISGIQGFGNSVNYDVRNMFQGTR